MSEYAGWIDGGATGAEALGKAYNKFFTPGSAIILNPASHQVTERGAGQNMSVDIAPGAGISALADYSIPVWSNAIVNKVVSAADPTNPRQDIVVRYVSLSSFGTTNNVGALKFIIVSGTPAGSPTDPSDATIQAAVGAGNPWGKLARITLPANATTVVNAYITDLRVPIAFAGNLWGGSSNTNGHTIPNVADDTLELLGANQTITGNKTFSGQVNINGMNVAGAWQAWTPVFTNFTLGNGTIDYAKYMQIGKTVHYRLRVTMGSTSVMGTSPTFALPVAANASLATATDQIGTGQLNDADNLRNLIIQVFSSATTILMQWFNSSANIANITATSPFTFAVNDQFMVSGTYEAA